MPGATLAPGDTVNFRLSLPRVWNRTFYFQGTGGFAGTIGSLSAREPRRGSCGPSRRLLGVERHVRCQGHAPTLIIIIVGEQDAGLPISRTLYEDLVNVDNKVRLEVACPTHFMVGEETEQQAA
jgi:hypothetical protein